MGAWIDEWMDCSKTLLEATKNYNFSISIAGNFNLLEFFSSVYCRGQICVLISIYWY
jgi:hypothetical protein